MKIKYSIIKFRNLLIAMIALVTVSCSDDVHLSTNENDFYNLEIDEAWIPVMVRGNTKSGVILLYVQGGPGYPSIDYAQVDYPSWKNTVEKDFAVAYYDQRGFGNKQGKVELSMMTMEQYQKDILQVTRFLKSKYPGSKVILFAHSWGGSLAYHFMINHEEKNSVDALISICGPFTHDGDNVKSLRWNFRRDYLINVSDILIAKGGDVAYWQEAKQWAVTNNPIASAEQMKQWNIYVAKAEKFTEPKIGAKEYAKIGFASSYNIFSSLQYGFNDEVASKLIQDEQKSNIADDLVRINKPVLMIGARYDDQAPAEELTFIFNRLGSVNKTYRQFDNAGHNVFLDDQEGFASAVREFCGSLPRSN
jgi:pimeloyl-ACP methyl ester carboxylesterase